MLLITFTYEDFEDTKRCHNDPMVVKIEVSNFLLYKVLLDNGSSTDVLYWYAIKQLDILESQIESFLEQLIAFLERQLKR